MSMLSPRFVICCVLLLVAGRAAGQNDTVQLSIGLFGPAFTWSCTATSAYCSQTETCGGGIYHMIGETITAVWNRDTLNAPPVMLIRDTGLRLFRFFSVRFPGDIFGCSNLLTYTSALIDQFTNIPYVVDSQGDIEVTPANLHGTSYAQYGFAVQLGCKDDPSCYNTGEEPVTDSLLGFRISPLRESGIAEDPTSSEDWFVPSKESLTVNSKVGGNLVLMDLLGRIVRSETIPSGVSRIALSTFAPGCYFVRLGHAVAKFVVAP